MLREYSGLRELKTVRRSPHLTLQRASPKLYPPSVNQDSLIRAEEVVREIRQERKDRIELFDKHCPSSAYAETTYASRDYARLGVPTSARAWGRLTDQDREDAFIYKSGPRADFVNGKLTLEAAVRETRRQQRFEVTKAALSAASLPASLMDKNQDCVDFVDGDSQADEGNTSASALISRLQEQKALRIRLLDLIFSHASIVDTCIDYGSAVYDNDPWAADGDRHFPTREYHRCTRMKYIELGEGEPDDVLHTCIMQRRMQRAEKAICSRFGYCIQNQDHECWMRKSKTCKEFVARVESGLPTDEEIEALLQMLEKKINNAVKTSDGAGGTEESDDERSSYIGDDYDYDYDYDLGFGYGGNY
eukprot:Sro187_g080930.2  (362) ;mRNA; r:43820-44997